MSQLVENALFRNVEEFKKCSKNFLDQYPKADDSQNFIISSLSKRDHCGKIVMKISLVVFTIKLLAARIKNKRKDKQ